MSGDNYPIPIVFVAYLPEAEKGGQVNLLRLLRGLDRTRFSPTLTVPREDTLSEAALALDVPVYVADVQRCDWWNPAQYFRGRRGIKVLRAVLQSVKPAIVYVDAQDHVAPARAAIGELDIRLIWHAQTSFRTRFDSKNLSQADVVVSCSDSVASRFEGMVSTAKQIRIPNAVDCEQFRPDSGDKLREDLGADFNTQSVLFVGEFSHHKGLADLIEAFSEVSQSVQSAQLWVAGRGTPAQEAQLKRRVEALGLTEQVQWLGYRKDIPQLLNAADLFAFPSHIEGMSLALLEAMAAGAAIVASDIPANTEVIADGTGLLVPVSDTSALSAAIVSVLSSPDKRANMGQMARIHAESNFAINHFISAFDSLFAEQSTD